jgi:predicted MPP superfamily phosphohydrolase
LSKLTRIIRSFAYNAPSPYGYPKEYTSSRLLFRLAAFLHFYKQIKGIKISVMNLARFVFAVSVFAGVYFGMNHFVYSRLASGLFADSRSAIPLRVFLFFGSMTFFLGMFYRVWPPLFNLLRVGNVWLGLSAIAFTALLIKLPLDFAFPIYERQMTLVSVAIILAVSGYSYYNAARPVRVKRLEVHSEKFPAGAGSFKLVHVSDLHLSRLKTPEWLDDIISKVNGLSADAIVITGDVVDDDMPGLEGFVRDFKGLRAKYGVFAVAGNHDHYSGIQNMYELERAGGVRILTNEKVTVGGAVEILGVDDEDPAIMSVYKPFLARNLNGASLPVVLLKHRPTLFEDAADAGVFLQLSGHTHAGQIPPLDLIIRFVFKYPFGLYKRGSSYIQTSCGSSTWGPPMRTFSRSEVTLITISR